MRQLPWVKFKEVMVLRDPSFYQEHSSQEVRDLVMELFLVFVSYILTVLLGLNFLRLRVNALVDENFASQQVYRAFSSKFLDYIVMLVAGITN